MSNTESFVYIRHHKPPTSWHRVGVIMFVTIDNTIYVSASLCNPLDKFNRNAAIGMARKRWNTAYNTFHLQQNNTEPNAFTVDSKTFLRPITDFNLEHILHNLRILHPMRKHYTVDMEDLDDMVTHELNDHIEKVKRG